MTAPLSIPTNLTQPPPFLCSVQAARWLRVHDLRGSGPQTVTSITAHTKAVQGLALDPWEPHHVATYSDNPLEPIKVWDLRKVRQTNGRDVCSRRQKEREALTPADVSAELGCRSIAAFYLSIKTFVLYPPPSALLGIAHLPAFPFPL